MKLNHFLLNVIFALALVSCGSNNDPGSAYTDWDADKDNRIAENEFYDTYRDLGYYDEWDANDDMVIDEEEWNVGMDEYYSAYGYSDYGVYGAWDLDGDGFLTEDEFAEGTFGVWDQDGDGYLTDIEYNEWYYGI